MLTGNTALVAPLVVDLDGTLILTDTLHESALRVSRYSPLKIFRIPLWLRHGKAFLKQKLARLTRFDPTGLPYNKDLLEWLAGQKAEGRTLILCTAADQSLAVPIAEHLQLFDEVIASDGETNLAGPAKAALLKQRFGVAGFDYVGNSKSDLAVWRQARRAVVVNASTRIAHAAGTCCEVEQIFPTQRPGFNTWRRVLRMHQWLKNLLLFMPVFAAHRLTDTAAWWSLAMAFIAFSLCASSVYIANDLLDLDNDRLHPHKRYRPFAAGQVPTWVGVLLQPLLLIASLVLAALVNDGFLLWLSIYFVLTCTYSLWLKRFVLVDCLILAFLYTLRIIAGAAAVDMGLSFWLLSFSIFLFLSLAFLKRYSELILQNVHGVEQAHGRGYLTADAPLIQSLGIASGYAAVLVLAFYLNSDMVLKLYRSPAMIWGAVPVMLFWISWVWLKAHRGEMHDDPVVFAATDTASWLALAAFAVVVVVGTLGWP